MTDEWGLTNGVGIRLPSSVRQESGDALSLAVSMQSARKEPGLQAAETPACSDRSKQSERVPRLTVG